MIALIVIQWSACINNKIFSRTITAAIVAKKTEMQIIDGIAWCPAENIGGSSRIAKSYWRGERV